MGGSDIVDLEILATSSTATSSIRASPAPPAFVDPAIVSAVPASSHAAIDDGYESSEESSVDETPYTAENDEMYKDLPKLKPQAQLQLKSESQPRKKRDGKKKKTRSTLSTGSSTDGWMSENITNIKDTEFDFQANLNLFDKQSVFEEIKMQDAISPDQRLVAHNKRQEKYGHREMVLPTTNNNNNNDEFNVPSIQQLRKGSQSLIMRSNSVSPFVDFHFTVPANSKPCPCCSPVQMLEIERISRDEFGLNETTLIETSATGIAQLALKCLGGTSRFTMQNHNAKPLVVALVGNNKAGAKALSACRHLLNRHVQVVIFLTTTQHCSVIIQQLLKSIQKSNTCKVISRFDELKSVLLSFDSPVELIIDGLQGYEMSVEDLWDEHQDEGKLINSIINWANNERAGKMSLDIPSGLDPSTGLPLSNQIFVNSRWVLSFGLPLMGLLNAHLAQVDNQWIHYLIDNGFPRQACQNTLRKFAQVWFGADWILDLELTKTKP